MLGIYFTRVDIAPLFRCHYHKRIGVTKPVMINKYITSLKVMGAVDSTNFWLILKKLRQFSYLCGAFFAFKAILICKNKEEAL